MYAVTRDSVVSGYKIAMSHSNESLVPQKENEQLLETWRTESRVVIIRYSMSR